MNYGDKLTDFHQTFTAKKNPNKLMIISFRLFDKQKMLMKQIITILSIIFTTINPMMAQEKIILGYDKYISDIKSNHPSIGISRINNEIQAAKRKEALGAFDPIIGFTSDRKEFKDDIYYTYQNAEVKLPTWFGVELYSGVEKNGGLFSNPELTVGDLTYAGISVPLGRDLLIDKRRAKLSEAKLMQTYTEAEQRLYINDLLLDASMAYVDWSFYYAELEFLNNSLALVNVRKQAIINAIIGGDRAATDSIEINAQYNSLLQSYQASLTDFLSAQFNISSYLWSNDGQPVLIRDAVIPDTSWLSQVDKNTNSILLPEEIAAFHPKIKILDTKIKIEEVGRRMALQSILPKADLKYNILSSGSFGQQLFDAPLSQNYKIGFDFSMPIPNRSGFANHRIQKAKIVGLELERDINLNQLSFKVRAVKNEIDLFTLQLKSVTKAVNDYSLLRDAEQLRFSMGESSVFMLNARDNKVIESGLKALEVKAKLKKTEIKLNGLSLSL
jgi:outer membrane protein TolC